MAMAVPASVHVPRKRTPFVHTLYSIVDDPVSGHAITWTASGDSLLLSDTTTLSSDVLPRFLNHTSVKSFEKQLKKYGFSKSIGHSGSKYSHPSFKRNDRSLMSQVLPQKRPPPKHANLETLTTTVTSDGSDLMPHTSIDQQQLLPHALTAVAYTAMPPIQCLTVPASGHNWAPDKPRSAAFSNAVHESSASKLDGAGSQSLANPESKQLGAVKINVHGEVGRRCPIAGAACIRDPSMLASSAPEYVSTVESRERARLERETCRSSAGAAGASGSYTQQSNKQHLHVPFSPTPFYTDMPAPRIDEAQATALGTAGPTGLMETISEAGTAAAQLYTAAGSDDVHAERNAHPSSPVSFVATPKVCPASTGAPEENTGFQVLIPGEFPNAGKEMESDHEPLSDASLSPDQMYDETTVPSFIIFSSQPLNSSSAIATSGNNISNNQFVSPTIITTSSKPGTNNTSRSPITSMCFTSLTPVTNMIGAAASAQSVMADQNITMNNKPLCLATHTVPHTTPITISNPCNTSMQVDPLSPTVAIITKPSITAPTLNTVTDNATDFKEVSAKIVQLSPAKLGQLSAESIQMQAEIESANALHLKLVEYLIDMSGYEGLEKETTILLQDKIKCEVRLAGLKRSRDDCEREHGCVKEVMEKHQALIQ